jgi:hypothetical protein
MFSKIRCTVVAPVPPTSLIFSPVDARGETNEALWKFTRSLRFPEREAEVKHCFDILLQLRPLIKKALLPVADEIVITEELLTRSVADPCPFIAVRISNWPFKPPTTLDYEVLRRVILSVSFIRQNWLNPAELYLCYDDDNVMAKIVVTISRGFCTGDDVILFTGREPCLNIYPFHSAGMHLREEDAFDGVLKALHILTILDMPRLRPSFWDELLLLYRTGTFCLSEAFDKIDFISIVNILLKICEGLEKCSFHFTCNEYYFWGGAVGVPDIKFDDPAFIKWLGNLRTRICNPPAFFDYLKARCEIVVPPPVLPALSSSMLPVPISSSSAEDKTCCVCMEKERDVTLVPCGHVCCCLACAEKLVDCPICRKPKTGVVKLFFA